MQNSHLRVTSPGNATGMQNSHLRVTSPGNATGMQNSHLKVEIQGRRPGRESEKSCEKRVRQEDGGEIKTHMPRPGRGMQHPPAILLLFRPETNSTAIGSIAAC